MKSKNPSVQDINIGQRSSEEFRQFLRDKVQPNIHLLTDEQQLQLAQALKDLEEREQIELARTDFLTFVKLACQFPFKFSSRGQHHQIARSFERMERGELKRLTISLPPRWGKALHVDEVVPTPTGWARMGDLRVGDEVFSIDGTITKVVAVSQIWKDSPLYKVNIKGSPNPIIADSNHEWEVRLDRKSKCLSVNTSDFLYKRQGRMRDYRAPAVRIAKPLQLPDSILPIPPYTLGAWLGDGHSYSGNITQCGDVAESVLNSITDDGFMLRQCETMKDWTVLGLFRLLRENGLLRNKHIPQQYLRASVKQRAALLAGLIDTDGHVQVKNGCTEIVSKYKRLADNVKELVVSLGYKCSLHEDMSMLDGRDCGPRYRVTFFAKNAARCQKKRLPSKDVARFPWRYITLEECGYGDTVCIEIEHPSHLFLAGRDMVPTHNSELGSILFPAWFLGKDPTRKVMCASANEDNATTYGRKVKAIIESDIYRKIFPNVSLSKDSKAAARFATNLGGEYFAVGITTGIAGKGADLFICDDIVNEQDAKSGDPKVFETAWTWFQTGPLQRLQPGGRILHIGTRWSKADPIGKVKKRMREDRFADKYESIEFKALDENDQSNFPEYWSTDELIAKRHNMLPYMWASCYNQEPTAVENSVIPAVWWREWDEWDSASGGFVTPEIIYSIMAMDTAYTITKRSNPSAMMLFGVFRRWNHELQTHDNAIILLHTYKKKLSWGELKVEAKRLIKDWEPDTILIEAKTAGPMLIEELRMAGIYAQGVRNKNNADDKLARINSVSDTFRSGCVYYIPTQENKEAIQEISEFPSGESDDCVDCTAYALRRFRDGGFVKIASDLQEEDVPPYSVPRGGYY